MRMQAIDGVPLYLLAKEGSQRKIGKKWRPSNGQEGGEDRKKGGV